MKVVEIRRTLKATPARVWSFLTDATVLQTADSGITKIEGRISDGSKFKLWSEIDPNRAFSLKVTKFDPGKTMIWTGGMPLGLFVGKRVFKLIPQRDQTELHIREEFSGLLASLIVSKMPDLQPSFSRFMDAVQLVAEGSNENN